MLGIRLNFTAVQVEPLRQGYADWLWPMAEEYGIPIMAHTAIVMPEMMKIVSSHPKLRLIIDHMGVNTDIAKEGRMTQHISDAVALAKYPNVSIKMSNLVNASLEPYPFRDLTPHLQRVFEAESGRPLGRFFERWIYETGIPRVRFSWRSSPGAVTVSFVQTGRGVYDLPVTVTIVHTDGRSRDIVVQVTDTHVEQTIPVDAPVREIQVNRDSAAIAEFSDS